MRVTEIEDIYGSRKERVTDTTSYFSDPMGSVDAVLKYNGRNGRQTDSETFEYDVFGRSILGDLALSYNIGFNGKSRDPETGLVDFGFRHYCPTRKQWMGMSFHWRGRG